MGFDTIEINLIFLVASKMGLVIVLANLASEMKPSLEFFLCVKSDSEGICSTKDIFPFWIIQPKQFFHKITSSNVLLKNLKLNNIYGS